VSRKGRCGCLYLNPSGKPVQCAKIPGLSCPARSVTLHAVKLETIIQITDLVVRTAAMTPLAFPATTKRTKVQCPLNYLSTTSMGITGIEETKAEYFSISQE
jgi:hypothetical protein